MMRAFTPASMPVVGIERSVASRPPAKRRVTPRHDEAEEGEETERLVRVKIRGDGVAEPFNVHGGFLEMRGDVVSVLSAAAEPVTEAFETA